MDYRQILSTVGSNIYDDLYLNFIDHYPLELIINPNNYLPVFTTNIINDDRWLFNVMILLLLFIGDIFYAFVRLVLALVVLSIYFCIFSFLLIWLIVTLKRRWKVLMIYVRGNDVLMGVMQNSIYCMKPIILKTRYLLQFY